MKKKFILVEKLAAVLLILFLPTQLALHFWPPYSFVYGIRVDYLSPSIYLTDGLVLMLAGLAFSNSCEVFLSFLKRNGKSFGVFIGIAILNILFSSSPEVSLFRWLKICETLFLGIYIYLRKDLLGTPLIVKTLFISALAASFIGILQFFLGRTTGLFYLLGERSFNISTPGIALADINGKILLRAYSVFSHPNSFAGFLGVIIIMLFSSAEFRKSKLFYAGLLIICIGFLLTFSLSAYTGLGILIMFLIFKVRNSLYKKIAVSFFAAAILLSLTLPVFSANLSSINFPQNISQRLELSIVSGKMLTERFLVGEGLNTFVINSVRFKGASSYVWLLQPVHNILLLVFSETGILGLLGFLYLFYSGISISIKSKIFTFTAILTFILFTGLNDHYWVTIQQNIFLTALVSGLYLRTESKQP